MTQTQEVLIVEDDADWLEIYSTQLAGEEYNIITARTVKKASKLLGQHEFAVVATDLRLLGAHTGGFDILEMVRKRSPDTQVIIFTGVGGKQDAFEATRRGAYDYVTKPLDYDHVRQVLKAAIGVREQKLSYRRNASRLREIDLPFPERFIGSSRIIKDILSQVANVIGSEKPVLVQGAAGTGKALIAETIHLASKRKHFISVNCAGFSETMLERTLFGFQKDAFPGAVEDEPGLLEQASGGTLVLDRVSDLSPRLQSQLFSILHHQRARRIASAQAFDIEVRVLATSRVDLKTYAAQGLFSQDLYEYLSVSVIELPPLQERKDEQTDDVLLLTGYFLDKYAPSDGPPLTISAEASELLQIYHFPGNVRELEEAIRMAVAKAESGIIEPHHLPNHIQNRQYSTKLVEVARGSLPESIICPHGYSLAKQAREIAQTFDTENYVYWSSGEDASVWYQSTVKNVLTQFGLKSYDSTNFSNNENFCPICRPILSSHLVILNISASKPITFYELGLAHAIGVPCVILKKKESQVPKDLGQIDLLEYQDEASLRESLWNGLNRLFSSTQE